MKVIKVITVRIMIRAKPTAPDTMSQVGMEREITHFSCDLNPMTSCAIGIIDDITKITVEMPLRKKNNVSHK